MFARGNLSVPPIWCMGNQLFMTIQSKTLSDLPANIGAGRGLGLARGMTFTQFNTLIWLHPYQVCKITQIPVYMAECKAKSAIPKIFMCDKVGHILNDYYLTPSFREQKEIRFLQDQRMDALIWTQFSLNGCLLR